MRAFMVCRNFTADGGMLGRNGIVQGLPADESVRDRKGRQSSRSFKLYSHSHSSGSHGRRSGQRSNASSGDSISSGDSGHSTFSIASRSSASSSATSTMSIIRPSRLKHTTQVHSMTDELRIAVSKLDHDRVHTLLKDSFGDVAVGEYSWLTELRQLGLSPEEIADELLDKSRDGPWIFSEFEKPNAEPFADDFHNKGCLHRNRAKSENWATAVLTQSGGEAPVIQDKVGTELSIRESIEFFCGVGGVSPVASGADETRFGSVVFEDDNATAIASLATSEAGEVLQGVLQNLEHAAGVLQQAGGCCDSFTFLVMHGPLVELQRLNLRLIRDLCQYLGTPESLRLTPETLQLPPQLFPWVQSPAESATDEHNPDRPASNALTTQFLSLAFLSYSQAHCGHIRPFFLDTPLQHILLIGDNQWRADFQGPCIVGSLTELSCFGDMLQQPVFVFKFFDHFDRATVFSETRSRLDLVASPEDLLDTWGPGELIASKDDSENVYAISIGGGLITSTSAANQETNSPALHWSRTSRLDTLPMTMFRCSEKVKIGARVSTNDKCEAEPHKQLRMAFSLLEELGTFPGYWEVSERQLGLGIQAGQSTVAFLQFNQTWVKRYGLTKKSKMLAQKSLYLADLEGLFGVQVSVCTGIARRIRLRDLLADVLPAYVGALVTKPRHWKSLLEDFDLLTALRGGDLGTWLGKLDHDLQKTFESLVVAVLFLLQDTGVDRKGQNFIIGCIQPDLPFQSFTIPCRRENYWARMVADSEDIATFAYMTTQCLETDAVKCRGSGASWANSTALFWTAVSCCPDELADRSTAPPPAQWTLKHSEAYLIGKVDAPLLVQVDRPNDQEEPRLLVSVSTIRSDTLRRLYRKGRPGKPRRLRERRAFDQIAESVVVIANHGR